MFDITRNSLKTMFVITKVHCIISWCYFLLSNVTNPKKKHCFYYEFLCVWCIYLKGKRFWREEILADRKSDIIWQNLIWRITKKLNFGGNLIWRITQKLNFGGNLFWRIERNIFAEVSWQRKKFNKRPNLLLKLTNFSNEIKGEEFLSLILCIFMFLRLLFEIAWCSKYRESTVWYMEEDNWQKPKKSLAYGEK